MKRISLLKENNGNIYRLFLVPVFFILYFLYTWLGINPRLYYQAHEPVFFFGSEFFNNFFTYPGGIAEYIGSFLSQFYYYPFASALIITIIAWLISLSTKSIIKSVSNVKNVEYAHLIPAVLLLLLHNSYDHQLSISVGLLLSLGFYNLFSYAAPTQNTLRIITYLFLSIILYFIVGGQFFLFTILCIILEISRKRLVINGLFYAVISAAIPYIAANYLFIYTVEDAYLHSLGFEDYYNPFFAPYLLYLYFPLIMLLSFYFKRTEAGKPEENKNKKFFAGTTLRYVLQMLVFFAASGLLLYSTFDSYKKNFLSIDYFARQHDWKNVLKNVTPEIMNDKVIAFQFNRALYHTGQLSEKMFVFPQPAGTEGLILTSKIGYYMPLSRSDFFFELGYINEAQHWVCEALAISGYTPWNLQRLTLISILKGEDEVARKCLNLLDKTLLFRGWAKHYRKYINNKSLILDNVQLKRIKSLMPKSDFIVLSTAPDSDMESLLQQNKTNKMAYEYMMAYYLLTRKLNSFIRNLDRFPDFGYTSLPRHYEEAILAYMAGRGREAIYLPDYHPSAKVINDFKGIREILNTYGGDKQAAYNAIMKKYSNTYWAYLLYE